MTHYSSANSNRNNVSLVLSKNFAKCATNFVFSSSDLYEENAWKH